jgi:hypothetical protein
LMECNCKCVTWCDPQDPDLSEEDKAAARFELQNMFNAPGAGRRSRPDVAVPPGARGVTTTGGAAGEGASEQLLKPKPPRPSA